jgi:hypothetical protein
MEQSPTLESNSSSACQEILRILRKPEVHHRILNSPPPVPVLSQINTVYSPIPRLEYPLSYYLPIYV